MKKTTLLLAIAGFTLSSSFVASAEASAMQKQVRAAMKMDFRTQLVTSE